MSNRWLSSAMLSFAFLIAASIGAVAQLAKVQTSIRANNGEFVVDLSRVPQFDNATVTITNAGSDPVLMPEITNSEAAPMTNSSALLSWLHTQGGASGRQLAEAAWQYVMAHMVHWCASISPYDPSYPVNPWKILRGYGFGCCDQAATLLAWLWQVAGMQSRVVAIPGHVVAEVYYDGDWHMYDADHRVYYQTSNGTVANVAMVTANPALVASDSRENGLDPAGWPTESMASLYANAPINYSYLNPADPTLGDAAYPLAPGETLQINSDNLVADVIYAYTGSGLGLSPAAVFSGTLTRTLSFNDPQWRSGLYAISAMDVQTTDSGVGLTNTDTFGSIVLSTSWPGPALNTQLDVTLDRVTSDAVVNAYYSADGISWTGPYVLDSPVGSTATANIAFVWQARGAYSQFVKLEVRANTTGAVRIDSLRLTSNVQIAKAMMPTLISGGVNHLVYRDTSPETQSRNLTITVQVNKDPDVPAGMTLPVTQNGTVPPVSSVDDLEAWLRSALPFYPWLACGTSSASEGLWQAQQGGSGLQATTPAANYLALNADVFWTPDSSTPTAWALARRDPVSLNFNWVEPPSSTYGSGTSLSLAAGGDQFVLSTSQAGTLDLVGRPVITPVSVTSLVPEDSIYSTASGYSADHLTDSNLRTLAYPGGPIFDYVVDLGSLTHVTAASLLWGNFGANPDYIQSWILYGRGSASDSWQPLASGNNPGAETTVAALDAYASQLRIKASGSNWIGMYELKIAASAPLAITAFSNLIENTNAPYYAPATTLTDGDDTTLAYPGGFFADYSLDPSARAYIDQVRVVWGSYGSNADYIQSWRLYGQKQVGTTWEIIARGTSPGVDVSVIPVHRDYRRLRIAAEGGQWIGLYEAQVYGNLLP